MAVSVKSNVRSWLILVLPLAGAAALAACVDESNGNIPEDAYPITSTAGQGGGGPDGGGGAEALGDGDCSPVVSAQAYPARSETYRGASAFETQSVPVDELWGRFYSLCGACHVDVALGGYITSRLEFAIDHRTGEGPWGEASYDSMFEEDLDDVMPTPEVGGVLPSERTDDDPTNELAQMMRAWLDQGSPIDFFDMPVDSLGDESPYRLEPEVAESLTNLGTCIPNKALIGTKKEAMDALDERFAVMAWSYEEDATLVEQIGLPASLDETDLTSFDTKVLARHGVLSYAATYPSHSDNAPSLLHIRVPRGKSIGFDAETQQLNIPANTRFYRTLLRSVVDTDGEQRWRKIETRLIVSRPDVEMDTGRLYSTSLYGAYEWNQDETRATLVADPLRDGSPFRDRLRVYINDELKAAEVLAEEPRNRIVALEDAHALRRHAIPGASGCYSCHQGQPSGDFVLSFTPLQLRRRPVGEGGVSVEVGSDELGQLDRFIEYGLITGLGSEDDVVPLEESQGGRQPRNEYELRAQAYLLANCANCHSPTGMATNLNPELADVLDFMPSETGGVFQFPLERYSPRVTRGVTGDIPIPYITPSLFDLPNDDLSSGWTPKYTMYGGTPVFQLAPWRSAIYRGVDTPFSYSDDYALFSRMPMYGSGFDCDAPRIMTEWMLSIPSHLKHPQLDESKVPAEGIATSKRNFDPQPYEELSPDASEALREYVEEEESAAERFEMYETGLITRNPTPPAVDQPWYLPRSQYCPDQSDLVDTSVLRSAYTSVPGDAPSFTTSPEGQTLVFSRDGVPDHAHYVIMDLSEASGTWGPRRPDWAEVMVNADYPPISSTDPDANSLRAKQDKERTVVDLLVGRQGSGVRLDRRLREFAVTERPMALWVDKEECHFPAEVPIVRDFGDGDSDEVGARWMKYTDEARQNGDAPVFMQAPGEYVFNMVCATCHGKKGDSHGRQATILAEMTGGNAIVTNLRDGMMQAVNQRAALSPALEEAGLDGAGGMDDSELAGWAARYFVWMGLGGTNKDIPTSIINVTANSLVFGEDRNMAAPNDANMLAAAQDLCRVVWGDFTNSGDWPASSIDVRSEAFVVPYPQYLGTSLTNVRSVVFKNGDAELWLELCAIDNPAPVRIVIDKDGWTDDSPRLQVPWLKGLRSSEGYPETELVANHLGSVDVGIEEANALPFCLRQPATEERWYNAEAWRQANPLPSGDPIPFCPVEFVAAVDELPTVVEAGDLTEEDRELWAALGAINAGLAAYVYLDGITRQQSEEGEAVTQPYEPPPEYDECETLYGVGDAASE